MARRRKGGKLRGRWLAGGTMMLDPQDSSDMLLAARFHLEAGARAFADWAPRMVADFGEAVRPHLNRLWTQIGGATETTAESPSAEASSERAKPALEPLSSEEQDALKELGFTDSDIGTLDPEKAREIIRLHKANKRRGRFLRFAFAKNTPVQDKVDRILEEFRAPMAQAKAQVAAGDPAKLQEGEATLNGGANTDTTEPRLGASEQVACSETPVANDPGSTASAELSAKQHAGEPATGRRLKKRKFWTPLRCTVLAALGVFVVWLRPWPAQYRQYNRLWGGFTDYPISEQMCRVTFEGNAFTSLQTAEDYALLRTAEFGGEHMCVGFSVRQRVTDRGGIFGKPRVSLVVLYRQRGVRRSEVEAGSVYLTADVATCLRMRYSRLYWWERW